jgi:phosphatidylinositol alpha-1,6-mannosyltransferase
MTNAQSTYRLRIGIVSPEFPPEIGGMETLSLELAEQLAQQHEVIVFTIPGAKPPRYSFTVAATLSGSAFEDIAVLNVAEVDIWLTMNASYAAIAPKLTAPVVAYVHGNDFLSPWRVFPPRVFAFLWTTRGLRRLWPYLASIWGRAMIAKGSPHCARILTNSTNTRDLFLRTYKVDPQRVAICPPGVSDMFFQEHEGSTSDNLHLVSTCRLHKNARRKNIDGVLHALAEVKGDIRIRYTIIGYGEDRARLESIRDILGLSSIVEFRGRVSSDELMRIYRTADLFVLPVKATKRDIEGFGIVYIEANAAGIPVLASAKGGALDAILDGRTGILLAGSEPADIAQGLRKFAASRQKFDPAAITAFASTFRWPRMAAQVLSHLYDCLGVKMPIGRNE